MDVIFYSSRENDAFLSIIKWAQSVIPPARYEICRSLPDLETKLRLQSPRYRLAVFYINTVEEMDRLILARTHLDDVRIILLVPDVNRETAHKGHRLYPRFMTDMSIDTNLLATVIKKNLEYLKIDQLPADCANCRSKTLLTGRKKP